MSYTDLKAQVCDATMFNSSNTFGPKKLYQLSSSLLAIK
ncbi:hypothetical protein BH11BAC6_BH11BAC6_17080 [soil metagenome]